MFALPLLAVLTSLAPQSPQLKELQDSFEALSGSRVVYKVSELPEDDYFGSIKELSTARRIEALRLLLPEIKKYPKGYLKSVGVHYVGILGECSITKKRGYFPDGGEEGERYDGLWANNQTILLCLTDPKELAGTWHHEVFHAVDSTKKGDVDSNVHMESDDARFAQAINHKKPYAAVKLSEDVLEQLKARSKRKVLRNRVSEYAAYDHNEDQAETALYMFSHLPDALVQMATQPSGAGTQRLLHVLAEYEQASKIPFNLDWLVAVALGETPVAQQKVAQPSSTDSVIQKALESIEDHGEGLSLADAKKIINSLAGPKSPAITEEVAAAAYLSLHILSDEYDAADEDEIDEKEVLNLSRAFSRFALPFLEYYLELNPKTKKFDALPPTDSDELEEFIDDIVSISSELSALGELHEVAVILKKSALADEIAQMQLAMLETLDRYRHQLFQAKKLTRSLDKGLRASRQQFLDSFPEEAGELYKKAHQPWKRLI